MDRYSLIPRRAGALAAAATQSRLLAKVVEGSDIDEIEAFFRRHPEFFENTVFRHYPFSPGRVRQLLDNETWACQVFENRSIPLSEEMARHQTFRRYGYQRLTSDQAILWTPTMLEQVAMLDDWEGISAAECLPWTPELIEEWSEQINWSALSENTGLPWSIELIQRYHSKWNWTWLSANPSLPLTVEMIGEFHEWQPWWLSRNPALPWSQDLVERLGYMLDCHALGSNKGLPWSIDLIAEYGDYWDWAELSRNQALPWSESLLDRYQHKWDWYEVSGNAGIRWAEAMVDKYHRRWVEKWDRISQNPSVEWSADLLAKYFDRWDWPCLSSNEGLPWSGELLRGFEHKWLWRPVITWSGRLGFVEDNLYGITRNAAIPWNFALLDEFADRLDLGEVAWHFDGGIGKLPADRIDRLIEELIKPPLQNATRAEA